MEFTWDAYKRLIGLLKSEGYSFTDYHNYQNVNYPCVILRHDIDNCISKAREMAELEHSLGVHSTYFVLLTSEFYNTVAECNIKQLHEMKKMGHAIGLHFDEKLYSGKDPDEIRHAAERERKILESILDMPIREISMHRPSKIALEANWKFDSMVNSYGDEFFKSFKYLSDSRMQWREDVEAIIQGHQYDKLHILTHAIWYGEKESSLEQKVREYISNAGVERWDILNKNLRNLEEIVERREIKNV